MWSDVNAMGSKSANFSDPYTGKELKLEKVSSTASGCILFTGFETALKHKQDSTMWKFTGGMCQSW